MPTGRYERPTVNAIKDVLDKLIASHALSLEVTLVTNNEADFRDVPDLLVENWVNNH